MHRQRRRQWHPTPVLSPGKSHGRRSLVGSRLWGHTESDTTEVTQQQQEQVHPLNYFILLRTSELEFLGAFLSLRLDAVYGVAKSRTRLKRRSSRSSIVFFVERSLQLVFIFGLNQTVVDSTRSIPSPLLLKFILPSLFTRADVTVQLYFAVIHLKADLFYTRSQNF